MLSTPLRPTPPTRVALLRGDRRCRSRRPIGSGRTRSDATAAPSSADEPDRRTRSIGRHLHLTPLRRQTSHRPTALCRAIFERSGADLESGSESDGDGEAEELSGPHVGWVFDEDTATEAEVLMMAAIRQSRSNNVVAHNPARHPVVVTHAPQKRPPREEKPTPRSNGQGAASENPETSRASEGPKAARPGGMPIVFVTAEVAPWSKTGGLGDVCGALPAALAQRGHSVVVVSPRYEAYPDVHDTGHSSSFHLDHAEQTVTYWNHRRGDGVNYVFVSHPALERGGGGRIYGDAPGRAYPDNDFRFALLSMAAIEAPLCMPWEELFCGGGAESDRRRAGHGPGFSTAPVFVANDWHAALVPLFLAARYQALADSALRAREWSPDGAAAAIARATCVTIVHNLFHLGCFPSSRYRMLGLPEENTEWFPALRWRWTDGGESMNFLKAGLAASSAAVLVSPSYCEEVQTNELGCGMDKVLKAVGNFDVGAGSGLDLGWLNGLSGRLNGIVNGIDVDEWNPATDPHIPVNYSIEVGHPAPATASSEAKSKEKNFVYHVSGDEYELEAVPANLATAGLDGVLDYKTGKARCKAALQRELGLHEDPDAPLVGFIGRLDQQKGVDVLLQAVPHIVANGGQVVMLGSGDPGLEDRMRQMEDEFKGRAVGWVGFSVPVSHRITAAADILAMPSRFEPCGLNQLYALRYGTIPVAHATGGLKDTVRRSVGFPFSPCEPDELRFAMDRAFRCYRDSKRTGAEDDTEGVLSRWERKQVRGMRQDLSWGQAAEKYEKVFKSVALPAPPEYMWRREHGVDGLRLDEPGAVEAVAVVQALWKDQDEQWAEVGKRAERVRKRAGASPHADTRTKDQSIKQPLWATMLPQKMWALFGQSSQHSYE